MTSPGDRKCLPSEARIFVRRGEGGPVVRTIYLSNPTETRVEWACVRDMRNGNEDGASHYDPRECYEFIKAREDEARAKRIEHRAAAKAHRARKSRGKSR